MLARRLKLELNHLEVGETPMLVPAISSRLNLPLNELIETIEGVVEGPLLLSAYDFHYAKNFPSIKFSDLIFLDSGGYECNKEQDISDIGLYNPHPNDWSKELHESAVGKWDYQRPTVLISFDHPKYREPLSDQIQRANQLFGARNDVLKEILLKPESKGSMRVDPNSISGKIDLLSNFNIIGITEKELGYSVLERMVSITKIRRIIDDAGYTIPIHIFGSLDPVITPLYFIAGADIFDGLSWLRFFYSNGDTMYGESFGPKQFGVQVNLRRIWIAAVGSNYNYMQRMKLQMQRYADTGDFGHFGTNSTFFKGAVDDLITRVGVI